MGVGSLIRALLTSTAGSTSPALRRFDTVSQNGLLVILVSDVNERDHEHYSAGHL
jgi:hypothetical protein